VRGSARRKEIAIRAALGATRARIAGQLLSESLLLAAGGGVFGLLLAGGAVAVVGRIGPANVPRLGEAALNLRLFLFALAVSAVCGLLFGLAPALDATRSDLAPLLNEEGRGGTSGRAARMMRQALAVMEIAIAVIVLIGSGLLIRSFVRLRTADPGFDPKGLLTMRIPLGGGKNASREQKTAFVNAMLERVSTLPGVRSAGVINGLPLNGALGLINGADFVVEGRPAPPSVRHPNGLVRSVTPDYFRTMRIPLIWGRCFSNADTRQSKPVIMVNRTLARQVWPNGEPMGTRLVIETNTTRVAEIIGVVGDVKPEAFGGEDWPMIYNPYAQVPLNGLALVMRTEGPPAALAQAAAREIHRLDPEQVITDVGPVEGLVDRAVAGTRFNMALLTTFAAIAFLLASLGVYGVVSYDVGERTNEIGVRMALGALPGDVLRMVLGQGARIAAGGVALGLAGAFWLTRLMSTMLYGVNPQDAGTFAAVSILLAGVALAASFLPSRRAMMLDPVAALRRQ
jgi:putative ABC transport system permease protein